MAPIKCFFRVNEGQLNFPKDASTRGGVKRSNKAAQTLLREFRKYKEQGHESQFSEDQQTLLFSQLCLAAL